MSYPRAFALITCLVLLLASGIAQSVPAQQTGEHQPITEELSHGATLKFKIAPDLPEFTFKVIPEVRPDADGNPQSTIQDVQVFRGSASEPSQSLEDCEWAEMEPPYRDSHWFRVEDMNFDGYGDIFVLTNWGATGNQSGCVWLYNPKSGHFDFSKEFSELGTFGVDPATKTISTHGNGGMAGTIFRAAKYVVEDDRPIAIIFVAQDYDFTTKKYHCVVQQRRSGTSAMITVRDVWAESKGDLDGPCDPSNPFRGIVGK
jgi:hypothetical protein